VLSTPTNPDPGRRCPVLLLALRLAVPADEPQAVTARRVLRGPVTPRVVARVTGPDIILLVCLLVVSGGERLPA